MQNLRTLRTPDILSITHAMLPKKMTALHVYLFHSKSLHTPSQNNKKQQNLPQAMSSGDTRPLRSGSSPYQNIHSSFAACNESGGGAGDGAIAFMSKMLFEAAAAAAAAWPCDWAWEALTRRQTQRMSPARQREKLASTGSSRRVPPKPPATSPHTSFRHFIPHRSVWKIKLLNYNFSFSSRYRGKV